MPFKNKISVDKLLTKVAVKYRSADFIADKIALMLPVKRDSDVYRIYTRDFRLPETLRANKGKSREATFDVSTASYKLERHSLKDWISQDDIDNYDGGQLRADTTEHLVDIIDRRKEKMVFDLITTTSFSNNVSLAAAGAWSANTTVSNPLPVVETGLITALQASGYEPNVMTISRTTLKDLKVHVSILDRIKYTSAELTTAMLQGLFEIKKDFLVSNAQIDSAAPGATDSIGAMWGDVAALTYTPARATRDNPATMYSIEKPTPKVRRWFDDEVDAEAIEVDRKLVVKVVASLTGYLIKDVN